jgi:ribokinase
MRAPHLPALDETVAGSSVDYVFGGKGGNQAVAAARMGAKVSFIGRTGSDRFGDILRETLGDSRIDLSQLQRDPGPSGMSAAIVNSNGEYGAVIVSAANLNIEAGDIFVPQGTTHVLLQNEISEEINLDIAIKAKAVGAQVWLNAAPARTLSDALITVVDLLIVNRVEAEFYKDVLPLVDSLTTLGSKGVLYQDAHFPAHRVDVVSTHGAGDMLMGALASEVDRGQRITDAIGFAQAAAALHVSSNLEQRKTLDADVAAAFLMDHSKR